MGDKLAPKTTGKIDNNGDLIVAERETEEAVIKTVKYGVIRIMGDPTEYRISYQSLKTIADKPPMFSGEIIIPELHAKLPINRIVFQQIREEEQKTYKSFAKLPTELVDLDIEEDILLSHEDLKSRDRWREATAHYQQGAEGKEYYLGKHQLKICLYKRRVEGESPYYPPIIYRIERYGVEQIIKN